MSAARPKDTPASATLQEILECCRALDNKKGEAITVLDVRGKSSVTDFFVLATGTSQPHLKALRAEAEKTLKTLGVHVLASDTSLESGWLVLDAVDFMLHVFTREMREHYGLEILWKDSLEVDWRKLAE